MSEERFQDLEMRVAFLDDIVDKLDQTVTHQQIQIEELKRQLHLSLNQLGQMKESLKEQVTDEPPPHY
ncbi:MAG: SlyX protein [Moraxellaceae bacterium]|nr:MAG: SlyX protein [Moraxellaceae bacterium]